MIIETLLEKEGRYIDMSFGGHYLISEKDDGDMVKFVNTTTVWALDKLGILVRDRENGGARVLKDKDKWNFLLAKTK